MPRAGGGLIEGYAQLAIAVSRSVHLLGESVQDRLQLFKLFQLASLASGRVYPVRFADHRITGN